MWSLLQYSFEYSNTGINIRIYLIYNYSSKCDPNKYVWRRIINLFCLWFNQKIHDYYQFKCLFFKPRKSVKNQKSKVAPSFEYHSNIGIEYSNATVFVIANNENDSVALCVVAVRKERVSSAIRRPASRHVYGSSSAAFPDVGNIDSTPRRDRYATGLQSAATAGRVDAKRARSLGSQGDCYIFRNTRCAVFSAGSVPCLRYTYIAG